MSRWYRLSMMALILVVWGVGQSSSLEAQVVDAKEQPIRFTKTDNGVITDRVTGLEWYAGPNPDNTWREAKAWTESLTVDGGGWRMPTVAELKAIYQKGASANNMDPVFQAKGAWAWSGELRNDWSVWGLAFYNNLEGWHSMNYGYGRVALAVRSRR
ncbi:MAG: DUF1566 domain-containing protein [Syntrophales bacterium]